MWFFFNRKWTIPYSAFLFYVSFTHIDTLQSQEKPLNSILFLPSVSTNRVISWRDLFSLVWVFFHLIDFWREEEGELVCRTSLKVEVTENIPMPKFLWGTPAESSFFKPGYIEGKKTHRAETSTNPWLWSKILENISISDHMEIPLVLITGSNCSSRWAWRISYTAALSLTPLCTHLCHPTGNLLCWAIFLSAFEVKWKIFNAAVASIAKDTKQDGEAGKNFQLSETKSLLHLESCNQTEC